MAQALPSPLHEPFETRWRQEEAARLGMWAFLSSEVLLFGALFATFAYDRWNHGAAFVEAARHTNLVDGTVNTLLLVTSSAVLTIAGRAQRAGRRGLMLAGVWGTLGLAAAFLAVKGLEYRQDLAEGLWPGPQFALADPAARLFFGFYWTATGLHACHILGGMALVGRLAWMGATPRAAGGVLLHRPLSMEATSLYWHLVDIVWLLLWPLLYLVGR